MFPDRYCSVLDKLETDTIEDIEKERTLHWWWLVFDEKNNAVAYAGLYPWPKYNCCFLGPSGVLKSAQGYSLQKRLVRTRLKKAKLLGFNRAVSYTWDNTISANNLIDCGFRFYTPTVKWAGKVEYFETWL